MNNENIINKILIGVVFVVVVILVFLMVPREGNGVASPEVVQLAKCLASQNVAMYGAYWCPHCQNQKEAFGSAFQYIPYVECTQDTKKCIGDGVNGYPTWIFGDPQATSSKRLEGEQSLEKLAAESGCTYASTTQN
jgi:hypothetical protein